MSGWVFIAVIAAAALHALWNALVKGGADKTLNMGAVIIGHAPLAILAVVYAPLPAPESLPYLFVGLALHFGYQWFLLRAYLLGDLTQVYPIARGSAPLIVASATRSLLLLTRDDPGNNKSVSSGSCLINGHCSASSVACLTSLSMRSCLRLKRLAFCDSDVLTFTVIWLFHA